MVMGNHSFPILCTKNPCLTRISSLLKDANSCTSQFPYHYKTILLLACCCHYVIIVSIFGTIFAMLSNIRKLDGNILSSYCNNKKLFLSIVKFPIKLGLCSRIKTIDFIIFFSICVDVGFLYVALIN